MENQRRLDRNIGETGYNTTFYLHFANKTIVGFLSWLRLTIILLNTNLILIMFSQTPGHVLAKLI